MFFPEYEFSPHNIQNKQLKSENFWLMFLEAILTVRFLYSIMFQPAERPSRISDPKKNGGFVKYEREPLPMRQVEERLQDWNEVVEHGISEPLLKTQSARCMDCGTPFCQQVLSTHILNIFEHISHILTVWKR